MVDAEASFRAAGLGALVDAYRSPGPAPSGAEADAGSPAAMMAPEFDDERPNKPRLLGATHKRGVMRLRVATPRGWDAIFKVNGKSYVRANGSLTLRARKWKSVSVLIEDKCGVRSEPLNVRRQGRR